ncbi:unnamed protein product [Lactuca saligna]|uniref:Uncharacterized protein n=1 Tax=Lactuca saligna TaxID=75948 RepID=A0AA35Y5L5_LACSI|nr:unnamed protein product [Lactuca saligna]
MDQNTFSYTTSSSSSNDHPPKTISYSQLSYHNSLQTVRKSIQKPTSKHFIAPLPPTQPKVYKVDSSNSKEIVHALNSDTKYQSSFVRRLKDIAPPPFVLSTVPKPSLFLRLKGLISCLV